MSGGGFSFGGSFSFEPQPASAALAFGWGQGAPAGAGAAAGAGVDSTGAAAGSTTSASASSDTIGSWLQQQQGAGVADYRHLDRTVPRKAGKRDATDSAPMESTIDFSQSALAGTEAGPAPFSLSFTFTSSAGSSASSAGSSGSSSSNASAGTGSTQVRLPWLTLQQLDRTGACRRCKQPLPLDRCALFG